MLAPALAKVDEGQHTTADDDSIIRLRRGSEPTTRRNLRLGRTADDGLWAGRCVSFSFLL
jgi:hypothetical protein